MHRPALLEVTTLLARPRGVLVLSCLMYVAAALHSVILAPLGWPSVEVLWSAMLVPTIALSFYYGRWGAAASVAVALALFAGVERLVHGDEAFSGERLVFAITILLAVVV
ncbi:MAG TPA: hypothetical protein VLC48_06715, partial [Gemmatimonadota bacterium]|nr:hypothetical protein [Gemmatimonadota bacterium]